MPKLDLSAITDQEAFERLKFRLMGLSDDKKNVKIVSIDKEGQRIVYTLGEVLDHARAALEGKPDEIGMKELKYAKERIAYERGSRSST